MTPTPETDFGWRADVLAHFSREGAAAFPLTLVHDPDGILADPLIQAGMDQAGFRTCLYDDPLRVRHIYETDVRAKEAQGGRLQGLVIVHQGSTLQELPFDLLSRARNAHRDLAFSSRDIFPTLAPAALEDVEPQWFDRLHDALTGRPKELTLGIQASRDLLVKELFGLDLDRMQNRVELLASLCRLHLERKELSPGLAEHVVTRLQAIHDDIPLHRLVTDRSGFLSFLQDRWESFVTDLAQIEPGRGKEPPGRYGVAEVPIGDPSLKVWLAALFVEGQLTPVVWPGSPETSPLEFQWGLTSDEHGDSTARIAALVKELGEQLPTEESTYEAWLNYAPRWGELADACRGDLPLEQEMAASVDDLWVAVDERLRAWMAVRFGALQLIPKPVMLHQVLRHLQKQRQSGEQRIALLLMDGMAWPQWIVLRNVLWEAAPEWSLSERSVFAWVPTITPVSRQALFSGRPPREFGESIDTTTKDGEHWARFWSGDGLNAAAIRFEPARKHEAPESALGRVRDAAEHPMCRVFAMIVPTIDEMAHGSAAGTSGLQAQVRHWARTGWLKEGIGVLLEAGFEVWITSDHGNIECVGAGRPIEGVVAEQRGARARVYSADAIRRMVAAEYPNSLLWPTIGLPEDYLPLLSSGKTAFAKPEELLLSHGGISLEEVIVPLVRIRSIET